MDIKITLTEKEAEAIMIAYVEKEVPVHTAGKAISIRERYGAWTIDIEDPSEDN